MMKKLTHFRTKLHNRSLFLFLVAAAFLAQFSLPSILSVSKAFAESEDADNGPKITYISSDNAPTIYGTSEITVPEGTEIDYKHDARFRVFARDNEDEDLTYKIESTDTFNEDATPPHGDHTITHRVTDNDGNTTELKVPVHFVKDGSEIKLKKLMYTLPSVAHLNNVGQTRGNNHDRQIIGIFVDAGGSFQMRKVAGTEGQPLNIRMMNNDSNAEPVGEYYTSVANALKNVRTDDTPVEASPSDDTSKKANVDDKGWITIENAYSEAKRSAYNKERSNREKEKYTERDEAAYKNLLMFTPTVFTPYQDNEKKTVEYEVKWSTDNDKIKPLHYYHQGDGKEYEAQFFQEWNEDQDKTSYAIIDGWSMMTLVPPTDKNKLLKNTVSPDDGRTSIKQFNTFDEWCDWWNRLTAAFDDLIGISYTPKYWWDQNVKTKFFGRANASGAGAAYYAGEFIGINNSVDWTLFNVSWGNLHETGHGYQGSPGKGNPAGTNSLTEVTVNIFSYYTNTVRWEDLYMKFGYRDDWLRKSTREKQVEGSRDDGTQDDFIDMRGRTLGDTICNAKEESCKTIGAAAYLYVFANLLDYFAELKPYTAPNSDLVRSISATDSSDEPSDGYVEAYSTINKLFRKTHFLEGRNLQIYDLWATALHDKYNVNVVPYFESWGAPMSQEVKDELMASDAKILFNLKDMVTDDTIADRITKELDNIGKYDIVSMSEAATSNLKGNLKINFEIDDFEQIKGNKLYLKSESETTAYPVTSQELIIKDLPVGTYRIAPPKGKTALDYENQYFIVSDKNENNEYTIKYETIDPASSGNDIQIYVRSVNNAGQNDPSQWNMSQLPFTLTTNGNKLNIKYVGTRPNSGSIPKEKLFSSITVKAPDGDIVHERSVNGGNTLFGEVAEFNKNNNVISFDIDLPVNSTIELVYNTKKVEDFVAKSLLTGEDIKSTYIDFSSGETLNFTMTEYGLVPSSIAEDKTRLYELYRDRVTNFANQLSANAKGTDYLDPFKNQRNNNRLLGLLDKFAAEDIGEYKTFASTGKAPQISHTQNDAYTYYENIADAAAFKSDVNKNITISDPEEGNIPFEHDYVLLDDSKVNWHTPGQYFASLVVTDREGNRSEKQIPVTILAVAKPDPSNPDTSIDVLPSSPDPTTSSQTTDPTSLATNSSNSQNPSSPDTGSNPTNSTPSGNSSSLLSALTISATLAILTSATLLFFLFRRKSSQKQK